MRRLRFQFRISTLLWITLAVACCCASLPRAWKEVKPTMKTRVVNDAGEVIWTNYSWCHNRFGITIDHPASDQFFTRCPVRFETVESLVQ